MNIALGIILFLAFDFALYFIFIASKHRNKNLKLVEYSNDAGDKCWTVFLNGNSTKIKWDRYEDAKFYYDHISKKPLRQYIYEATVQGEYYVIYLDKCSLNVVPADETHSEYHYHEIGDYKKYCIFLNNSKHQSLEYYYKNIVSKDYWNEKTILSTNMKDLESEIDLTISNNDIKALRKIINEYTNSVELSRIVADKLCNNMKDNNINE